MKSGHSYILFLFVFAIILNKGLGQETEKIDSLKKLLPDLDSKDKMVLFHDISKEYLFRSADSCSKYGQLAINLAQNTDNNEIIAGAYKIIGYSCYRIGEYDKSIEYYKSALTIFQKMGDDLSGAIITNLLGDSYFQISDYSQAMNYFITAEKSCDSLIVSSTEINSVKRLYSILYINVGMLYHELDSVNTSLKYFNNALKYAEEIHDSTRITACYSNIGMVYKTRGKYDIALKKYLQALQIARIIGNRNYEIAILNNIANIYVKTNSIDSTRYYYLKAKHLILEAGDKYGLALVNKNIASTFAITGEYSKSIDLYNKALEIAYDIGNSKEVYSCYEGLSDLYKNMGNYNKAYYYQSKLILLKDSISGIETRERIADIHIKYETEKKEKENLSLRKNNEIQKLQLSRKNQLILTLVGGIMIFIVLSVFIFVLYRKRHIAYKQLVEKNLDLINCENKLPFKPSINNIEATNHENGEQIKKLVLAFDTYMKKEKPFLFSEISYDEVCKKLNTNRTYLSKAINESYNKSFPEVINYFRIKEASLYLSDPKYNHLSIEGIGQMTGFNYKAAFYSNFKKQMGITPSFFRKNAQG